jgi:hypothetical protein
VNLESAGPILSTGLSLANGHSPSKSVTRTNSQTNFMKILKQSKLHLTKVGTIASKIAPFDDAERSTFQ